jgi:hypothetical protein
MVADQDILRKVAQIDAELRSLAASAAGQGNWPVVRAASMAAEQLEPLRHDTGEAGSLDPATSRNRKYVRSKGAAGKSRPRRKGGSVYPRFARNGNDLVKIGWSKREGGEYRHRAPRSAVDLLVRAIEKEGTSSGRFTTDGLFPVIDPSDGSELPGYQGYLVLRWLREIGLISTAGRSEYIVEAEGSLQDAVEQAWEALPKDTQTDTSSGAS